MTDDEARPSKLGPWLPMLVPMLVACAVYARALYGKFVWDDVVYFQRYISGTGSFATVWWPDKASIEVYYRPMASLAALVLFRLFGPDSPFAWHVPNLLLHLGSIAGVYVLLHRWWARTPAVDPVPGKWARLTSPETAGTLLFAVWPVAAEPITWVSARTELMMTLFVIWALVAHLDARDRGRSTLLSAFLFFLALTSKEVAIVFLPLAVLATFLLPKDDPATAPPVPWRRLVTLNLWLPHLLLFLLYSTLRSKVMGGHEDSSIGAAILERLHPAAILPAFHAFGWYVREALLLGTAPPFQASLPTGNAVFAIAATIAIAAVCLAAMFRPALRPLAFAALFFVICLGPPLATAVKPATVTPVALRYLYLPCIALAAAAAMAFAVLRRRVPPWALAGALAVSVAGLGLANQPRIREWSSSRNLWNRALRENPRSAMVWFSCCIAAMEEFDRDAAIRAARRAAYDSDGPERSRALTSLAVFYLEDGNTTLARVALVEASKLQTQPQETAAVLQLAAAIAIIEMDGPGGTPRDELVRQIPVLENAAEIDRAAAIPRKVLSVIYELLDEPVLAIRWYQDLARTSMGNPANQARTAAKIAMLEARIANEQDPVRQAYFEAQQAEGRGNDEEAIEAYRKAVALDAEMPEIFVALADLHAKRGETAEAIRLARRATELSPRNERIWFNLGLYLGQTGDAKGSADALREAVTLAPNWAKPYFLLGQALEGSGDDLGAAQAYEEFLRRYVGPREVRDAARVQLVRVQRRLGAR